MGHRGRGAHLRYQWRGRDTRKQGKEKGERQLGHQGRGERHKTKETKLKKLLK